MAGPPMSMFSITSSNGAPRATVSRNGYRFTTTRSMGTIPAACISCRCWGVGRPRMPPCTRGCSVFTRPSRISGAPVNSLTSRTGTPPSSSAFAVPPVERISTPSFKRPRAKSSRPAMFETEIRAREILATREF